MHLKLFVTALACGLLAQTTLANPSKAGYKPINNQQYAFEDLGPWKEGDVTVPSYPDKPDWVGFFVPLKTNYQFFVDSKTLSIGQDGVVRFVLRVVSPSGAENVSYEGIRCQSKESRSYAFGDTLGKKWYESTRAIWKRLSGDDTTRERLAEDLCTDDWHVPTDAPQALMLLKKSPWR
ncbi:CNP1-like family protein [Paludibacterium purpuratum]|uniref:CNP1-like family protein n=1 Tax=Paludibacterium purpuratum TaxID=1144873 RepID=A0A4R7B9E1_9NEIS|nr:CNP1-like family protein [Paludibacterium purpuratum]TDR80415.1 CNP1-like family protein [Paludibacterium purpuratum]